MKYTKFYCMFTYLRYFAFFWIQYTQLLNNKKNAHWKMRPVRPIFSPWTPIWALFIYFPFFPFWALLGILCNHVGRQNHSHLTAQDSHLTAQGTLQDSHWAAQGAPVAACGEIAAWSMEVGAVLRWQTGSWVLRIIWQQCWVRCYWHVNIFYHVYNMLYHLY